MAALAGNPSFPLAQKTTLSVISALLNNL